MIVGIGIDAVRISEISHLLDDGSGMLNSAFAKYTFSERELREITGHPEEYLAARFAVKEAVFKAIAPALPEKTFDLRCVESSHHEDGSPYVVLNRQTSELMEKANVMRLHLSVTTEGDYAIAFVIAEN
ncbi:MAG: holo-ACP synthase [Lachnospiraceae bacterium]|jgi:holo-[acyl-carrier protein] synthase